MEHRDEHITCAECGTTFVFTAQEAESFAAKRLEPPKRCPECRKARRLQREGGRDHAPRGRAGGHANEYRSPMSDPSHRNRGGEYRSPGFRDDRAGRGEYRAPGFRDDRDSHGASRTGDRDEYRAPGFRDDRGAHAASQGGRGEYRAPGFRDDRGAHAGSQGGRGEYRAPGFRDDRAGRGEYRAPAFGGDRGGFRPRDGGPDRGPRRGGPGRGPQGNAPRGPRPDRGPRPQEGHEARNGSAERPRREPSERPSYPITCAACGVAAEVPFKPQEGRELLCRDCYRARKEQQPA